MVYARYSRTRKGSGAYGRKRSITRRRRTDGFKKVARPRFALSGYRKNIEKKYWDKTYQSNSNETLTGSDDGPPNYSPANNGVTYISSTWGNYLFDGRYGAENISNDMLKGMATGTTARTRIGNKVRVNYVKGSFTFTAATLATGGADQGGEVAVKSNSSTGGRGYLRTTVRFCIVKDMQVNSTDTNVKWEQVFDMTARQAGVHSELNVDNMGRFIVLEDKIFTLDAQSPQKTVPYMLSGSRIGNVRYNGPSKDALTDKGVYVVWAAFVMGYGGSATADGIEMPSPVGHSRMCFTDA